MSAAEAFTLIMAIGFAAAAFGAERAHRYMRIAALDRVRRAVAQRTLVLQVLIAVSLLGFLLVGLIVSVKIEAPLASALALICFFAAPTVLAFMSIICTVELLRIERMP